MALLGYTLDIPLPWGICFSLGPAHGLTMPPEILPPCRQSEPAQQRQGHALRGLFGKELMSECKLRCRMKGCQGTLCSLRPQDLAPLHNPHPSAPEP